MQIPRGTAPVYPYSSSSSLSLPYSSASRDPMLSNGGLSTKPMITLGNATMSRSSIMAYVRPCVVWAGSNICIHLLLDLTYAQCLSLYLTSAPFITNTGVQPKKMKSIQLHDYWVILLLIVLPELAIWNSWQVSSNFLSQTCCLFMLYMSYN